MKLKLAGRKTENSNTISFIFQPTKNLDWTAGQYIELLIKNPDPSKKPDERHFTISASPFEKNIMITTRFLDEDVSPFKQYLQGLNLGDTIEAKDPKGDFTIGNPQKEYVFIAGGIGITPFRAIILDLAHHKKPINITLLYSNKVPDFIFKTELEKIQIENPNFKIHYFVSPQKVNPATIKQIIPNYKDPSGCIFYISGPEPMVENFEQMLYQMGITENRVKRDYFPGYTWP